MSGPGAAIERVVRDYLKGMIHGTPSQIEAEMHPKRMQAGHLNGVYEFFDRAEFIAALQEEDAAPP